MVGNVIHEDPDECMPESILEKAKLILSVEQLKQLEIQVIETKLKLVEIPKSPRTGSYYNGYVDMWGVKSGWGTQIWPDGGKYEGSDRRTQSFRDT